MAVDHVLDGDRGTRGFAMIRPPGHHAERNRAMGFCLFNNIACAAAHARSRGLSRVAIVDYDVHHGNGTQSSFYNDPSVLFISSHQFPFYPGTGAADEIGDGAGRGFTVNLPIEAGATDADYELLFGRVVLPVLAHYRPQLILISAGFDAHMDDPLGGLRLTTGQFGRLTSMLTDVADEHCEGRVVAVTEGGYDLPALSGALRAVVDVLADETAPEDLEKPNGPAQRGEGTLRQLPSELSRRWTI
jgi:acetoin utilization deacetylase AcuC-like enzyme